MKSRIVVCIPKEHKAVVKAINKIANRQGLTASKVTLAILMDFLKRMEQIKTVSYHKKRSYIKKVATNYKCSASSELTTV